MIDFTHASYNRSLYSQTQQARSRCVAALFYCIELCCVLCKKRHCRCLLPFHWRKPDTKSKRRLYDVLSVTFECRQNVDPMSTFLSCSEINDVGIASAFNITGTLTLGRPTICPCFDHLHDSLKILAVGSGKWEVNNQERTNIPPKKLQRYYYNYLIITSIKRFN